jgi:hypothetical protein
VLTNAIGSPFGLFCLDFPKSDPKRLPMVVVSCFSISETFLSRSSTLLDTNSTYSCKMSNEVKFHTAIESIFLYSNSKFRARRINSGNASSDAFCVEELI